MCPRPKETRLPGGVLSLRSLPRVPSDAFFTAVGAREGVGGGHGRKNIGKKQMDHSVPIFKKRLHSTIFLLYTNIPLSRDSGIFSRFSSARRGSYHSVQKGSKSSGGDKLKLTQLVQITI